MITYHVSTHTRFANGRWYMLMEVMGSTTRPSESCTALCTARDSLFSQSPLTMVRDTLMSGAMVHSTSTPPYLVCQYHSSDLPSSRFCSSSFTNLRTTHNRDGNLISNITDDIDWSILSSGAWCNYQNILGYDASYGKLHNAYPATNANLCPLSWHVPTDEDWQELELTLGMTASELNLTGFRGVAEDVGGKMKSTIWWSAPNTGANNQSGFSGLPGGIRLGPPLGYFNGLGLASYWWSISGDGLGHTWSRGLLWDHAGVLRDVDEQSYGFYVRCLRD